MINGDEIKRSTTLAEVAAWSTDLSTFGRNLRDWQHEVRRRPIGSRKAFGQCLNQEPPLLATRFADGIIADVYLAAYAEWLASARKPTANAGQQTRLETNLHAVLRLKTEAP